MPDMSRFSFVCSPGACLLRLTESATARTSFTLAFRFASACMSFFFPIQFHITLRTLNDFFSFCSLTGMRRLLTNYTTWIVFAICNTLRDRPGHATLVTAPCAAARVQRKYSLVIPPSSALASAPEG